MRALGKQGDMNSFHLGADDLAEAIGKTCQGWVLEVVAFNVN